MSNKKFKKIKFFFFFSEIEISTKENGVKNTKLSAKYSEIQKKLTKFILNKYYENKNETSY